MTAFAINEPLDMLDFMRFVAGNGSFFADGEYDSVDLDGELYDLFGFEWTIGEGTVSDPERKLMVGMLGRDFEFNGQTFVSGTVENLALLDSTRGSDEPILAILDSSFPGRPFWEAIINPSAPAFKSVLQLILSGDDSVVTIGDLGSSILYGFDGDDSLYGATDSIEDKVTLFGGRGADLLELEIEGSASDGRIAGSAHGQRGEDTLKGSVAADRLFGDGGADELRGREGDDTLRGGDGADIMSGGDGNDRVKGDKGFDTLNGGKGDDVLSGGIGKDSLLGGFGADTLIGGQQADTLSGGRGADVFVFTPGFGSDRITDFAPGIDTLHLRNLAKAGESLEDLFDRVGRDKADVAVLNFGDGMRLAVEGVTLEELADNTLLFG